ncbi:DUF485 domain-containing protein [bacterium]|nr:MAG: DUF485 domain-containing protein [bacterium]
MALVKRKASLSRFLTLVMFVTYFGYVCLLAFKPEALSGRVGAATVGIPIGIGLILLAWVLTGIYVRWANGAYDAVVARLKSK